MDPLKPYLPPPATGPVAGPTARPAAPTAPAKAAPAIGRDQLALGAGGDVIARQDTNRDGYLSGTEITPELRPYARTAPDGRTTITIDGLTAKTKAPQAVQPPKTGDAAFNDRVLELTNVERTKRGLAPFTRQEGLDAVATKRSQDMVDRRYFSHTDPDGRSPFFHIQKAGIPHRLAAENIAYGQRSPEEVVRTWMNSAGHRANILNPGLKHLGTGAVRAANGQVYWTQLFTG